MMSVKQILPGLKDAIDNSNMDQLNMLVQHHKESLNVAIQYVGKVRREKLATLLPEYMTEVKTVSPTKFDFLLKEYCSEQQRPEIEKMLRDLPEEDKIEILEIAHKATVQDIIKIVGNDEDLWAFIQVLSKTADIAEIDFGTMVRGFRISRTPNSKSVWEQIRNGQIELDEAEKLLNLKPIPFGDTKKYVKLLKKLSLMS